MRVLLIATNQADRYMGHMTVRPLPVGLAYVAAHISETRHTLHVLDWMFAEDAPAQTLATVQRFQPEVIGLSIRNLDNQSYLNPLWHLPTIRDVMHQIRSVSPAPIVCGGPAFSVLPVACFEYLKPDLGLAGDAAESFAQLVDRLDRGEPCTDLPGIVYGEKGRTVLREPQFTAHFHTPPRLDLLDLQRYDKAGFGIGVITKLAPYLYATTEHSTGRQKSATGLSTLRATNSGRPTGKHVAIRSTGQEGWRIRPVEEVIEELRRLQRDFGISKVFFIDSGFNIPLVAAKELCQALLQSEIKLRWNSILRVAECDAELIDLMRRSGCSLALINAANLPETVPQVTHLTKLCNQSGLPFTLSVGFGDPGDTRKSVQQKLALLRDTQPAFAILRVATRVLPNTPVAKTALEEGLIDAQNDLIKPTFYVAAEVRGWLVEHLKTEAAHHPRWHLM
jgi:radical SAM superfamily enzyme YgiQ (UPF0313 family)